MFFIYFYIAVHLRPLFWRHSDGPLHWEPSPPTHTRAHARTLSSRIALAPYHAAGALLECGL